MTKKEAQDILSDLTIGECLELAEALAICFGSPEPVTINTSIHMTHVPTSQELADFGAKYNDGKLWGV
ncbi:MAG: hypothetical protein PHX43_05245 [Alphaproteobacteria bacterium]|nr:hypothetical protein [Alphaproteobacteria bacterium]